MYVVFLLLSISNGASQDEFEMKRPRFSSEKFSLSGKVQYHLADFEILKLLPESTYVVRCAKGNGRYEKGKRYILKADLEGHVEGVYKISRFGNFRASEEESRREAEGTERWFQTQKDLEAIRKEDREEKLRLLRVAFKIKI